MSCPKSAKTPHANTHPKTDARRCWTIFTWLLIWLSKYLYNFRNVHCIVQSPRTMKVKNISKGNKFILTTMVTVNAMQCKSTCACHVSNCSHCTDKVCHLTCFSVSFFLSCLSFSFKKKIKTKKGKKMVLVLVNKKGKTHPSGLNKIYSQVSLSAFFFVKVSTHWKHLVNWRALFFFAKKKQGSILKKEGN